MNTPRTWLACLLWLLLAQGLRAQQPETLLFVGTYTDARPDKGIYVFRLDTETGRLRPVSTGRGITNPSFLTLSADGTHVYACTRTKMPHDGTVSAFRFDTRKRSLTLLNAQPSMGENPVYVSLHATGDFLVNANYTEGSVTVYRVLPGGELSTAVQSISFEGSSVLPRQDRSHVHAAVFSPDQRFVFLPDLGADRIRVFAFDTAQAQPLQPRPDLEVRTMPGSGPRHFTFHPHLPYAYCVEELSGTVTAYRYAAGRLDSLQRVFAYSRQLPEYSSADIHLSPDGRFLYASNRIDGENTIAIFAVDSLTGRLALRGHTSTQGDHPRNFTLEAAGNFLLVANQVTNQVVVLRRDPQTGMLSSTGTAVRVPHPSCLYLHTYAPAPRKQVP